MSTTIDERVVTLKFNNGQFELGIKKTLDSLSSLKKGLELDGAKKGLDELDKAGRAFNMGNMGATIEGVNAKFLALATIAVTALASITKKAIETGAQLAKSLTIDPMKMGLQEYETNLNAIQTILANTQSKGTNLDQVNAALQELNTYSDQTIYNFSEMARNIGTFTAAGVDLDKSTAAIKGIANLAAVSGSNSQQASTAMYQLSQALAAGKVSLMDWNSVVNAGMGGEVFQNALKETARAHGVAVDSIIEKQGSFRDSLQEGWITSEILTETLSKFTGDLNAEQLKSMGYTDEQIQKIMQLGQTAKDAATKVKTFTQLQDTLKESAQSGWSQTWQIIFGDFEEAKELWTGVNNVLGEMISNSANARNEMLQTWKDLGGRTAAIEAVKNVFNALTPIINEVKQAFREFFPSMTGERLYELTERVRQFTETLKPSPETIDKIARAFSGLFAFIQIGVNLVKGIISVFRNLIDQADGTGSSILDLAARIGDWLVNLNRAIIDGKAFENFFGDVNNAINKTISVIQNITAFIKELFSATKDVAASGADGVFERIGARLEPLGKLGEKIVQIFTAMGPAFQKVWEIVRPIAEKVSQFFLDLGKNISESVQNMNFDQILDTVNTGLLAGLVLIFKKFLSGGVNVDLGGGFLDSIKGSFDALTGTLGAMQAQLKASALIKIAGAVALLTASVVALSLIDSAKLMSALSALTVMFLQLAGTMALVDRIVASSGFLKLPAVAGAMILLSTAILILSAAVRTMSDLSWEELGKGLSGVLALLGMIAGAAKLLEGSGPRLIAAGAGLILVATAVRILASAVEAFSGMSWAEMAQGLTGVAATLAALALFTKLADAGKGAVAQGAGLILLSVALKILANVVSEFGNMDLGVLTQGLLAMAGALVIIAGAMHLIPGNILVTAAGLVVVAGALTILSGVLKIMGGMTWEELVRGLSGLAGSLIILAGAMHLMQGAIGGAIALGIAAASLALLTPALIALSGLSWSELGMGLAALAGAFLVLGLAALVLTPVIPSLLGLGLAITLIGVGIAAAGVGILAFSAGFTALSVALAAGGVAIVAFVGSIIGLIPTALAAVAEGIVQFAIIIGNSGPVFVQAISTLLISIAEAIMAAAPVVVEALVSVIMLLIDAIAKLIPYFVTKGLEMITGVLNGIAKALPGLIKAGTDLVVNFLNGIAAAIPRIIEAAINLIISFVEGLAQGIRRNTDRMNAAGRDLADAIIDGAVKGISSGVSTAVNAVKKLATGMLNAAKSVLGINSPSKEFEKIGVWSDEGMVKGLEKASGLVEKAAEGVGVTAITTLKNTMSSVGDAVSSNVDMTPVIRPVLDLSQLQKDSGKIDGLLAPSQISPSSSFSKAATIASDNRAAQQEMAETQFGTQPQEPTVQFTQNNYSPKALSQAEIYRQTKNQISVVKGGIK